MDQLMLRRSKLNSYGQYPKRYALLTPALLQLLPKLLIGKVIDLHS
ncbi:hypothetical protein ALP73_02380 [Pseudomonas coronafaciens pv. garcae]|nr:hypothetical protein ALO57_00559 [Pseudomonas coronafaciens pv. oryzae]KPY15303.1 hypothetical protein ALO89_00215 [Pseudomonas coronafaciens pv. porri]KPZ25360.1 hypothetical protein ALO38_00280 [Pseudomonas coronafaciens pv. zizaniae]RMM80074.1 hypothetical protein ALQ71_01522 [Pseudomonas coronafaciens pv. striafaciens]RMS08245.1 hypothetical protein ALP73_02380 [Pseudomonas coronafaciens pv. garcae]RMS08599.1 hypothetical protein ALP72_02618 [Pseudomonas coronafaciens pv. coronafaciens]